MDNKRVLIVDDDNRLRKSLIDDIIYEEPSWEIAEATDGLEALQKLEVAAFDVVILDLEMNRMDGLTTLNKIRETDKITPVIILSGTGSIDKAVRCIKEGAEDYVEKPYNPDRMMITLRNAIRLGKARKEQLVNQGLGYDRPKVIGDSPAIKSLLEDARKIAATNFAVMLQGETGCGKEVFAEYIYTHSKRCGKNFIRVNCAAIPAELFDSEFFGHRKGAFSGARNNRTGLIKSADKGVLFLDEIGEIPLSCQAKLLRTLRSGEIRAVGSDASEKIDFRLISATNIDLQKAVKERQFRDDLYSRISEMPLYIPSLRERPEDIVPLAEYYIKRICTREGIPEKELSPDVKSYFLDYPWHRNVAELIAVLKRLVALSDSDLIDTNDLSKAFPEKDISDQEEFGDIDRMVSRYKRKLVLKAVERTGSRTKAAELLNTTRQKLWRILEEKDISQ
ncbi:MAG: response regulator [candidate division Zixibacteria bacterium]|nr:response regulator [candidate division Zixibacteria bacterium]